MSVRYELDFEPHRLPDDAVFRYQHGEQVTALEIAIARGEYSPSENGHSQKSHDDTFEDNLPPLPEIIRGGDLWKRHPELRETIIDGVLRICETCNVIASPKVGKSWFVLSLVISMAAGRQWLGFTTKKCRVLVIDNELHPETIAFRFQKVAHAMGLDPQEVEVDFIHLRGRLMDITQYHRIIDTIGTEYDVIVIDAKYRAQLSGASENSNTDETNFYNILDKYAEQAQAAIIVIHHSTKGSQSEKSVTDVGAGGGAQSRAADTHLVIRQHEEESYFVLDGVTRSFPPLESKTISFEWPLWSESTEVEPILKQELGRGDLKQNAKDEQGKADIVKSIQRGNTSKTAVLSDIGGGRPRLNKLFRQLLDEERIIITGQDKNRNGTEFDLYNINTAAETKANLHEHF